MKARAYVVFLGLLFAAPLAVLAVYAVAPGWRWPDVWPHRLDPRALAYLAGQGGQGPAILRHMGHSILYSLATVLLTLAFTILPAHHLARHRFRGKALVEGLLLAPALVPAMTFSMGVHVLFIKAGLADTTLGVVLVLATFSYPYMLRALIAGYQAFGPEYELCANNLGAGLWMRLCHVDFPLLIPSVAAGASVVFLVAFSEYFLVFLIGGGAVPSFTGYLFPYLTSSDRATAGGLTLFFLAVPVLLFLLQDAVLAAVYRKRGLY